MKLISDIINELVDTDRTVSAPLLKTKVLAHRTKNEELGDWASKELSGYLQYDELPSYRQRKGKVVGTFINGNMKYTNQPLPTGNFFQSITALEELISADSEEPLQMGFSAEIVSMITHEMREMDNPYFQVINAKTIIAPSVVTEIVAIVRSKLLDFMLKIDTEFGSLTEIEDLQSKNKEVNEIMRQTIINTTGDGNVITAGDNTKVKAKITVEKGNKESLIKHLENLEVGRSEIDELVAVLVQKLMNGFLEC